VAVPGRLPLIAPMLATPARDLPADPAAWAAEVKWDGVRALAYAADGEVVIRSRSGRVITAAFPDLAMALAAAAGRRTLILDGEIVALDHSRPSFALLQRRAHATRPAPELISAIPVTYVAFDLLRQASRDLMPQPWQQRRALLDALGLDREGVIVPPAFPGQASEVAMASRQLGLEGVVAKRLAARYTPGQRTGDWLKIKHLITASVLIGGWSPGAGWRSRLAGSVLVGHTTPGGLEYLGQVGSGFGEAELTELTARLQALEQADCPFTTPVPQAIARTAHWTRPTLTAEVTYTELTPSGRLRHPVWHGLRPA